MERFIGKKGCGAICAFVVLAGVVTWFAFFRSDPPDTRFNGAYRLDDGRLVLVTPREGEVLRYRMMSGRSGTLWAEAERAYESGPGWDGREPVELRVNFDERSNEGPPTRLRWRPADGPEQPGHRIDLPEIFSTIPAGELTLRCKLVLPIGRAPHPAVILVHGSGKESAVDTYYMAYLFAANGIATLVYDKRGTGGSTGDYNQNFHLLSDDTVAAVEWLRTRPEIDPGNIHLAGYSQGGWIAPLAASKSPGIRSLLINYGPMVPITEEDRWGYRYALEEKGFGDEALAEADRVNEILGDIFDHGKDRWDELALVLDEVEDEPWFDAVAGSDSMLGYVAGSKMPLWVARLYYKWMTRGDEVFADRLYDPVPTVSKLETPSLWIFGGKDSSMPSADSIKILEDLRAAGRPIDIKIFPDAEHGILLYEGDGLSDRASIGYAPGYLDLQVQWLRRQSGLDP